MKTLRAAGLAWLMLTGCRTTIQPVTKTSPASEYVPEGGCNVRDYPAATDVPEGAKNLGWVTVKNTGNDDDTFVELRKKICEMGGDALSQPAWVRESGEYEANHLKANAWVLP